MAATFLSFAWSIPASANPLGPNRADPVAIPPEMAAIMAEKRALSDMLALVNGGLASRKDYEAKLSEFVRGRGIPMPVAGVMWCPEGEPCASPSHKYLGMSQVPQWYTTYCGPASGTALLTTLYNYTSAYGGEGLSQGSLALNSYFETNTHGNTPWSGGLKAWPMPYGLNRWRQGTDTGWYVPQGLGAGGVSAAQYQNDLVFDISNGYPFLGNVAEVFNSAHLVGHPNQTDTIYHIIPIYGYSASGANTHYADPVAGTTFWWWSGQVPAYTSYSSSVLASQMLAHRGYVW